MTHRELQAWLETHTADIVCFMDYEPSIETDEELATTLGYWFDSEMWSDSGYTFTHLGIDGMGSQFAAWHRPGAEQEPPIVYFGSEGGRGVLVRSPEDWVQIIAHAPTIDEYPSDDGPAILTRESFFLSSEDPQEAEEARTALARYSAAVTAVYGEVPPLSELTSGLDSLNQDFLEWVQTCVGT